MHHLCRDIEDELKQEIESYDVGMRLSLYCNLGSTVALLAFAVSWVCGEEPLGELLDTVTPEDVINRLSLGPSHHYGTRDHIVTSSPIT
jgi:hypothetical protein